MKRLHVGHEWLRQNKKPSSPLGNAVADLLGEAFAGVYNAPILHHKVNWSDPHHIEVIMESHGGMGTVDCNTLTRLVFLAHDYSIRMEMHPHTFQHTKWWFTQRDRGSSIIHDHPTLEEAVEKHRRTYPKEEEYSVQREVTPT